MRTTRTLPIPARRPGRRRSLLAGAAVVAAGALAACTGPDATPEPSPTTSESADEAVDEPTAVEQIESDTADQDACELLAPDALTAVLGEPSTATAIPSGGWIHGQCAWNGAATGFILSVGTDESIEAFDDVGEPDAAAKLAAYTERMRGTDGWQEVADLGDGAVVGATGIAARVGETYLELENLTLTGEQLVAVMRLAVEGVAGA